MEWKRPQNRRQSYLSQAHMMRCLSSKEATVENGLWFTSCEALSGDRWYEQ